jgi:hypothetical protein
MAGLWLFLTAFCLLLQTTSAQSFITGFAIDSTGSYGKECELYSGSITSKYQL